MNHPFFTRQAAALQPRESRIDGERDQRLPEAHKRPYTLLIGMRSWWYQAFVDLRR